MKCEPTITAVLLVLVAGLSASPAMARDTCLVGHWSPVGNGAAEWVQRQAPGMKMATPQQAASLTLRADGGYSARSQMQAEATSGAMSARSGGSFSAQGGWSSSGGQLTLTPSASSMDGTMQISAGKGPPVGAKMPKAAAQPTTYQYSCSGPTLETRMRIPGVADPIVQRYRRQ